MGGGGGGSDVVVHQGGQNYIKVPLHKKYLFCFIKNYTKYLVFGLI